MQRKNVSDQLSTDKECPTGTVRKQLLKYPHSQWRFINITLYLSDILIKAEMGGLC